jgi:hypothetical protein
METPHLKMVQISDFNYSFVSEYFGKKTIITLKNPEELKTVTNLTLKWITLPKPNIITGYKEYLDNIDFNDFMKKYSKYMVNLQILHTVYDLDLLYVPRTLISLECRPNDLSFLHEFTFLKIFRFYHVINSFEIINDTIEDLTICAGITELINPNSFVKCLNLKKLFITRIKNPDLQFLENIIFNNPTIEDLNIHTHNGYSTFNVHGLNLRKLNITATQIDNLYINAVSLKNLKLNVSDAKIIKTFEKLDYLTIINGLKIDLSEIATDKFIIYSKDKTEITPRLPKEYSYLKIYGNFITQNFITPSLTQLILMNDIHHKVNLDLNQINELIATSETLENNYFNLKKDCHIVLISKLDEIISVDEESLTYRNIFKPIESRSNCVLLRDISKIIYEDQDNYDDYTPPVFTLLDNVKTQDIQVLDIYYGYQNANLLVSNYFKQNTDKFTSVETIYAKCMIMSYIPLSTTTFIGNPIISEIKHKFKVLEFPRYQCISDKSPKMNLSKSINSQVIEVLIFNLFDTINWVDCLKDAIKLYYLDITHKTYDNSEEIPIIGSKILTYYNGFIGLGNLPNSIQQLNYNVIHASSIEHLHDLKHLRLSIHNYGQFVNDFVITVKLDFLDNAYNIINGIMLFKNAENIEIRVVKMHYDYVLEFLKRHCNIENIKVIWDYADDRDFGQRILEINSKIILDPIYVFYNIY